MKIYILTSIIALFLGGCASATREAPKNQNTLAFGVYEPGHNITEPRPKKSEYLETETGGVVILPGGAGLFLNTRVIKHPITELYVTVEYENPQGGAPLTNDMPFTPETKGLHFSVPSFQTGLKSYADYVITVRIWEKKGSGKPIDTLVQKVRSYVDTTGPSPLLFDKLKQK
jgi:hypothetical protein